MDLAKFRKNRKGDFECSTMEIGNSERTDFSSTADRKKNIAEFRKIAKVTLSERRLV